MTSALEDPVVRWQRVATLLETSLEREPAERARYLDEACGTELALRAEVEELVACALTPSFLDSAALAFASPLLEAHGSVPNDLAEQDGESPYVLERKLGRGGTATVYAARDLKHDRRVAIKVLDAELTERVRSQRFVREIRLTARLQHPHVLALLDSGVFEAGALAGRSYYVMPYVAGESLRGRVARGPLPLSDAIAVLREVADALAYAHEQGVIHRDIKPENILLSGGHAVVADFGIAKAIVASQSDVPNASRTAVGESNARTQSSLIGTPAYMAPEQAIAGAPVDHRADLYAWGVVAYELLAGRHPFDRRASAEDLILAHRHATPAPLHQVAPAVPERVASLVMQCLSKEPAWRPATASEILTKLDASRATTATLAPIHRRRLRTAVAFGILLLADASGGNANRKQQPIFLTGTGDPARDVSAFQAAVDRGGDIVVRGRWSFALTPTKRVDPLLASRWYPSAAEILISKAANISGVRDASGVMATIESGTIPFYVDAPGESVTIRGLRFVRPIHTAILVAAARGLEISSSRIEGLVPIGHGVAGISITTRGDMSLVSGAGHAEDVSGHLVIEENEIDGSAGTAQAPTAGILALGIGRSPNSEAKLDIVGNNITNMTAPTVNIREVEGSVRVLGNTLRTSQENVGEVDAVRLVAAGSVLMANNTVECKWPNAAGILVFSPLAEWPTQHVTVENNRVLMSPSPGASLGEFSAGIGVRGFAQGNVIRNNTISGRAGAALSMYSFRGGVPVDNAFIDNRLDGFQSTVADIFIGRDVLRGHVAGSGTVLDRGTATIRDR